jgi:hypothetical protein
MRCQSAFSYRKERRQSALSQIWRGNTDQRPLLKKEERRSTSVMGKGWWQLNRLLEEAGTPISAHISQRKEGRQSAFSLKRKGGHQSASILEEGETLIDVRYGKGKTSSNGLLRGSRGTNQRSHSIREKLQISDLLKQREHVWCQDEDNAYLITSFRS